jgi:hypothetical protein
MGKANIDWEVNFQGHGEPSYVSQDEALAWFGEREFLDAVQGINNDLAVNPLSREALAYAKRFSS